MCAFPLAKQRAKSSLNSNCIKKMGIEQFVKMSQLRTLKNSPAGSGTVRYSMLDLNSLVFSLFQGPTDGKMHQHAGVNSVSLS